MTTLGCEMTLLTVNFPEIKLPNPVAVKTGGDTSSLETAWIVRVRGPGHVRLTVTVTRSTRLAPAVVLELFGLVK